MLPNLNTFHDVILKSKEIIDYTKAHPFEEHIYLLDSIIEPTITTKNFDTVIAGSKAITLAHAELQEAETERLEKSKLLSQDSIQKFINSHSDPALREGVKALLFRCDVWRETHDRQEFFGKFKPNDTDIFVLNAKEKSRQNLNGIDIIHTRYKNVRKLLLDFDLPCCRVARTLGNKFYISLQCLASLLSGNVYVPHYVQDKKLFEDVVKQSDHVMRVCFEKAKFRRAKYEHRGYKINYVETNEVLRCYLNPFSYYPAH